MLQDLRVIQKFKLDFPWQHNPTIPNLILNYKISLDFTRFKFWRHFGIFGKCSWNLMMSSCLKLDKFRVFLSLSFSSLEKKPQKNQLLASKTLSSPLDAFPVCLYIGIF